MALLECGYSGREKDMIRLCADLGRGWKNLGKAWGFDEKDFLDYGESKFRCRLRFVEKAPGSFESRKTFHERYLLEPTKLGSNSISLHGTKLEVDVPLAQGWTPTNDSNRRPCLYEIGEDIFSVVTEEGTISCRLQIWVVLHGESSMFVKDEHERGDGFAWIGGRPESNRRKF
jgi:hypothetical protein